MSGLLALVLTGAASVANAQYIGAPMPRSLSSSIFGGPASGGEPVAPLDVDTDGRLLTGVSEWLTTSSGSIPNLGIAIDRAVVWGPSAPLLDAPSHFVRSCSDARLPAGGAPWASVVLAELASPDETVKAIVQGRQTVLRVGEVVPFIASSQVVLALEHLYALDANSALVEARLRAVSSTVETSTVLMVSTDGQGSISGVVEVLSSGQFFSAVSEELLSFRSVGGRAGGRVALTLNFPSGATALWVDGGIAHISGDPSPLPGLNYASFFGCAVNAAGDLAFTASVDDGTRLLVRNDQVVIDSRDPHFLFTEDPRVVVPEWRSLTVPVLDEDGNVFCIAVPAIGNPQSLNQLLTRNGVPIVQPGRSKVRGGGLVVSYQTFLNNFNYVAEGGGYVFGSTVLDFSNGSSGTVSGNFLFPVDQATLFCEGSLPSTGRRSSIGVFGSRSVGASDLELLTAGLPSGSFAVAMASETPVSLPGAGGGKGRLCVGGTVFRSPARQVNSDGSMRANLKADLLLPAGHALAAGSVWYCQTWYRDVDQSGGAVSRFSEAAAVEFRL